MSEAIEGKNLFAQAVTKIEQEKNSAQVIRKIFDGFPGNVLQAKPVGEARVISQTATDAIVGVTVRFSVDMTKICSVAGGIPAHLDKGGKKGGGRSLESKRTNIYRRSKRTNSKFFGMIPMIRLV